MSQLQTLEAIAGAPDADRERLEEEMRRARSSLLDEYWQVERKSAELGRLYAASCRLHASTESEGVLQGIREVAGELLGCSRMALYELEEARGELTLVTAWGLSDELPSRSPRGSGPLGQAADAGLPWLLDSPPSPVWLAGLPLSAVAPLCSGGRVRAVLALLGDLAPAVEPEHAFELLATHAGAALNGLQLSRRARALMAV
jgi:hypothetical protein